MEQWNDGIKQYVLQVTGLKIFGVLTQAALPFRY